MLIGICGKSGSGKTTLANYIIELYKGNAVHIDIDKVGHQVYELPDVKDEMISVFGEGILTDGKVDRKKVAKIVFQSEEEMNRLTNVTWKYMQKSIDSYLDENKNVTIILDWLLLPKSKYLEMCDIKVLLDIPYEVRRDRAMARDGITEEQFKLRDESGIDFDPSDFDICLKENNNEVVRKLVDVK